MIKPFDSGWSYILDLSLKLISLLVIWSYNCNNAAKKKVTHLGSSIVQVFWSTLNIIPQWISKPRIKRSFKHQKSSSGTGQFALNLRICKNSHYDVRNCKSGRHNQWYSFKQHRPRYKSISINIPYHGIKDKGRKDYTTLSPHRQNRMLHTTICCQDDIICRSTRFKLSLLHFNKLDINNNHLSANLECNDHSVLNYPL